MTIFLLPTVIPQDGFSVTGENEAPINAPRLASPSPQLNIDDLKIEAPTHDNKGDHKYFDKDKQITTNQKFKDEAKQIKNEDLTPDIMKTNIEKVKENWNSITDKNRLDYMEEKGTSKLSAEQITASKKLRETITNPDSEQGKKIWEKITEDPEKAKARDVLEEMGYKIDEKSILDGWEWGTDQYGNKALLYQGDPFNSVLMDLTNGKTVYFNGSNKGVYDWLGRYSYEGNYQWRPITQNAGTQREAASQRTGGSGGGSGGGGGGPEQGIQQAMQIAQQMAGLAKEMFGPLAEAMKQNGQGSSNSEGPNKKGGSTTELSDGAALAYLDEEEKEKLLAASRLEETGTISTTNFDATAEVENLDILVPQVAVAEIPEIPTTIDLTNTIDGNDPSFPADSYVDNIGSLNPLASITGQAIIDGKEVNFGQYIKFPKHNMDISGRDLKVYALKTFNEVEAGGQDINVFSGQIEIKFDGQKLLYPRLVKNAPYGFKKVSNKLDRDNQYKLQHYTNKKSQLTDYKGISSIGDIFTKHPRNPGLIISKIRLPMWKTG